jgi:hypothetical protein
LLLPERNNLKGGKIYFGSGSEISDHGQLAILFLGTCVVRQSVTAREHVVSKVAHPMVNRREREEESEGTGTRYTFG